MYANQDAADAGLGWAWRASRASHRMSKSEGELGRAAGTVAADRR